MKLRNKTLISVALLGLTFGIVTYFEPVRSSLYIFYTITVIFLLLLVGLIRIFAIKPIKELNQEVRELNASIVSSKQQLQTILKVNHELKDEISEHISIENRRVANKEHITQIPRYDDLTALPNRAFFNEVLNKAINSAKRRNKVLGVLLIEAMIPQEANTEEALKEIGRRFAATLRTEDVLAKLDGSEFIVLLNDIGKPKFASTVAEKLLQVCALPFKVDAHAVAISANIGICVFPNEGDSLENILEHADKALFKTKHAGLNTYQFYTSEMDVEAREYIQLESALRKAIHNNELTLYYQPKLNIKKGSMVGLEALLRWEHPVLGIISPSKFIPLAEETGLFMQIGEWVLREACRMNKYWQNEGYEHLTVAINLSPKQFEHKDMTQVISKILRETELNPQYLEIEISENVIMGNVDAAEIKLNEIKKTGVQISIDHFGTGYTAISYLKQFPISVMKIDQNFIRGVPNIPNDVAITNAFIALAHNLGLEVIAEGVETAEQVQYLGAQGCDMVQGYFLSHPLPADKIVLQFKKVMERVML